MDIFERGLHSISRRRFHFPNLLSEKGSAQTV